MATIFAFIFVLRLFSSQPSKAEVFQEFSELSPEVRQRLLTAQQATVGINFLSGLNCSAVYVGNNGEALTNLHCIEECLEKAGALREELVFDFPALENAGVSKMVVSLPSDRPLKCIASVVHEGRIMDGRVEILAVLGLGYLSQRHNFGYFMQIDLATFLVLKKQGFESYDDLVLVRAPRVFGTSCAKIGTVDFINGPVKPVVNLAYTSVFRASKDLQNSLRRIGDRKHAIVSFGMGTNARQLFPNLDDSAFEVGFPLGTIRTSTDGEIGSSGSPAALSIALSISAHATDRFEDEIVCASGISASGITVASQTNEELGSFAIPLNQPSLSTPDFVGNFRMARYEFVGFELEMLVQKMSDGTLKVLGPAHTGIELPDFFRPIDTDLHAAEVAESGSTSLLLSRSRPATTHQLKLFIVSTTRSPKAS